GIQEKKAKLFNEWEWFTSTDEESNESYYHHFLKLMNDLKRNKPFPEKIATRAEGNATGHNGNQIRCYNCRGEGHFARNYTVRPRRRDLDEIGEVNANCILMVNLQEASTSGTQTDKDPVYDSDRSAEVIQICLWCVDTGCSKHMTRNLNLFINFIWKFLGTVRFGNDHVATILGQFCDSDLEVTFRRNVCFVRNLEGVYLLIGNRKTNLYTINLKEMASASPICLMARASSTMSWLWHQRLSHQNFNTINNLAKNDLVSDLPKFKYHKEQLCPSCEQGKSKIASHPPKPVLNSRQRLLLLHIDLYGPMRIASINGKCRSIIHRRFNKTPYELINGRKPDISFLYVFGALCYPKNDREDIGKLGGKGCSKHMTGNLKLLINFVWKFMGTVRFGNDYVAAILGFGQFCDSNLEVAFRRDACFVRNLEGVDLLKRDHSTNLYTINLHEMASASPICLMA
nr:retrovirus-related Pol polyprotein from transposon TNT 1-94 [Tanacetum cinerariifolium]